MIRKMLVVFAVVTVTMLYACSPADAPGKVTEKITQKAPAESQAMKIAKSLVKEKGDLNQRYNSRFAKDGSQIPILVWAISQSDVQAVKLLLDNGADPNIKVLARSTDPAIFEAIISVILDPEGSSLYNQRRSDSLKICELLVAAGAQVNYSNKIGETALQKAAGKGREDICQLLIAKGAKINLADKMGTTPLHLGAKYGYWQVVDVLLRNKAGINARNKLQKTPLKLAEERCDEDLHKKCRKEIPKAFANADYDQVIKILKSAGGR